MAPAAAPYRPAAQATQAGPVPRAGAYAPGGQAVHAVDSVAAGRLLYVPKAHAEHCCGLVVDAVAEYDPRLQPTQADEPGVSAYVPPEHTVQATEPGPAA